MQMTKTLINGHAEWEADRRVWELHLYADDHDSSLATVVREWDFFPTHDDRGDYTAIRDCEAELRRMAVKLGYDNLHTASVHRDSTKLYHESTPGLNED